MQREAHVQAQFLGAIGTIPGIHCYRINVLKAKMPSGAWVTSAPDGTPDVLMTMQSLSVAVECKRPHGGRVSDAQNVWRKAHVAAGGVWLRCNDARETVLQLAGLATGETKAALHEAASRLQAGGQDGRAD